MESMYESIYNLLPSPVDDPPKAARYKSKHSGRIEPKHFELGPKSVRKTATMGQPNGCSGPSPTNFLRKHEKEPMLPEPMPPTSKREKRNPPVPSQTERPVMGLVSNKNFVMTNAVEAILAKPTKSPEPEFWTQKKNYGKVPKYLVKAKSTLRREREAVEEYVRMREQEVSDVIVVFEHQEMPTHVTQLDEVERTELLAHLKTKWGSINTAYQKMTFTLDTPAKQKRKENYEKELLDIEHDIQMLERGDVVLVVDE